MMFLFLLLRSSCCLLVHTARVYIVYVCVCVRVCVHVAGQRVRAEVCVYIVHVCVCVYMCT